MGLDRVTELRDSAKGQVEETLKEKEAALESLAAANKDKDSLQNRVNELETRVKQVEGEHEDLLRRRVRGTEGAVLPEGVSSLAELVRELTTLRIDVLKEREAKEQLQEVLSEVEREVRERYPALM